MQTGHSPSFDSSPVLDEFLELNGRSSAFMRQ
jgi:hypothetical protein